MNTEEVRDHYLKHKEKVETRLREFEQLRDSSDRRLFQELVFVILSSQTSAKKAWKASEELEKSNFLLEGSKNEISEILASNEIQYEVSKADYIVKNREMLLQPTLTNPEKELKLKGKINPENLDKSRKWLAENIQGISWKGASHFLRNIGYGNSFGIISSHILTKLAQLGAIENTDQPSNKESYIELEKEMQEIAEKIDIDVKALDLVLWSMETGKVFK